MSALVTKLHAKWLPRQLVIKTNCFYQQGADEYFKMMNASFNATAEGFPAVFMSANACRSRHFRQCSCGISSESEAGLFCFLLLELTGESGKRKAEFSQDSKES